jgi:hypothetical protein
MGSNYQAQTQLFATTYCGRITVRGDAAALGNIQYLSKVQKH